MVKLLCIFDLPMDLPEQQRQYRFFRKSLIKNGFTMLQYSVYVRTCPNKEYAKRLIPKLEEFSPVGGNIRIISITEKQYDDMVLILGRKTSNEKKISNNRLVSI